MKTLLTKALHLLSIICWVSLYAKAQDWQTVGTPGFSDGQIFFPNIVLDANNTPYVAYLDYFENHHQVRVKKYNGSAWEEVGTTGFPTMADRVSLALDHNGMPIIAYQTFNEILYGEPQNSKIRVKRYTGNNWEDVGTTFMYTGSTYYENAPGAYNPALALDAVGTPYVAVWHYDYVEEDNNRLINGATVVRFNGSSWETVGEAGFNRQQSDNLAFALAPDGTPYIAFNQLYDSDGFESRSIVVMKYAGGSWVNVGAPGFSDGRSYNLNLRIDSSGTPYAAYIDSSPNGNTYPFGKPVVRKFGGSSWVDVGTSGLSDGTGNNASYHINLELDKNGVPYIAYDLTANYEMGVYGGTKVQKFDGSSWIEVGGMGFSPGSQIKDLCLDSQSNPFVFFQDQLNVNKATVMRFVPQAINTAPELAAIGNKSVDAHSTLSFQASATDDGLPNNTLNYSLATAGSGNYPTGATITASGAFTWIPSETQWQQTYRVKIVVSDGALSDEEEIQIQVNEEKEYQYKSQIGSNVAQFNNPIGVALGADGSVYVTDQRNNRVLKFNAQGQYDKQIGKVEEPFNAPAGIAVGVDGSVYVVDQNNHRVFKFNDQGEILGIFGSLGTGNGQFMYPVGVTIDVEGNVYVTDTNNNRVQKFSSQGDFLAKFGSQGTSDGEFQSPIGIDVDISGNIYVTDQGNHRVQKISAQGNFLAKFGSRGTGDGEFQYPSGIDVDSEGNILITDYQNHRVQKFSAQGSYLTQFGTEGNGNGQFKNPADLVIGSGGKIYVTDQGNQRVQIFAPVGALNTAPVLAAIGNKSVDALSSLTYQASATDDGLPNNTLTYSLAAAQTGAYPTGATITAAGDFTWTPTEAQGSSTFRVKVVVTDGELSDEEEIQIQVNEVRETPILSTNSTCLPNATLSLSNTSDVSRIVWYKGNEEVAIILPIPASAGTTVAGGNGQGSAANQLNQPYDIYVENNGDIYVADAANNRIQKWENNGSEGVTIAGGNGQEPYENQFNIPTSIFVDGNGNIYVADGGNQRVQKWALGATSGVTVAGGNGQGAAANQFFSIEDIFVDDNGNIYVADAFNHRIQKWAPGATSGVTVAGGNGQGSAANQFDLPTGVLVDGGGNIYVADAFNHRIQKWAPGATSGVTVAGGNGQGSAANQFSIPNRLFIKGNTLYVSDRGNSRIQRWEQDGIEGVTVAGGNGQGSAANQFNVPLGVIVDQSGNIYVADTQNNRIQKWAAPTITTTFTPTAAGVYKAVVTYGSETVTTNTVTINEALPVSVSITASPSTTISTGNSVTFTAIPTNGGSSPAYQWKVNGSNVGTNSATYTSSTLSNGDVVTCILTSNAACATGSPATSNTLTMVVNSAPVLAAIGNKSVAELALLSFPTAVSDDGLPNNSLSYSLVAAQSGAFPTGAAIDNTGTFSWTPTEAQGPGTYRAIIRVSDGVQSDEEQIDIQVTETNALPVLASIGDKQAIIGTELGFTIQVTDSDIPAQAITYSASTLPAGATFDNTTGAFSWTPANNQAGTYTVTFSATDGVAVDDETITISVVKAGAGSPPKISSFTPTSGPVGTSITITGTNFINVSSVTFNDLAAGSYTVNSSTSISAQVPQGATSGKLSVITLAGSTTSKQSFTVTGGMPVLAAPTISSFSPTSGAPGTSVTITGSNFINVSTVAFNGTPASFSVGSSTSITAVVPGGATSGKVSVTTPGGTATSKQNFRVLAASTVAALAIDESQKIVAYPNPFSEKATIEFSLKDGGEYLAVLYDAKGAKVALLKQGRAVAGGKQIVEVNGRGLRRGLYLVRLETKNGSSTIKLMLNK